MLIGFATLTIIYFAFEERSAEEKSLKDSEKTNHNSRNLFDAYPTSDKVEFSIQVENEYFIGEPIDIVSSPKTSTV